MYLSWETAQGTKDLTYEFIVVLRIEDCQSQNDDKNLAELVTI